MDTCEDWVRRQMQELGVRDTDALMTLWLERQNGALAAERIEAIRRLLLDRVGFLPPDPAGAKTPAALQNVPQGNRARLSDRSERDPFMPPQRLRQISTGAQVFSWIYLISGLVAAVIQALQVVNRNGGSDLGFTILTMVLTALQAGFFFLVLQVMAESILMGRRLLDRKHQPASVVSTTDAP